MRHFDEHGVAVSTPAKPRQQGMRLTDLRQRLTRTLIGSGETDTPARERDLDHQLQETRPLSWEQDMPRFAVVRHGYHCAAVDEYVGDLERELGELDQELAQLRTQVPAQPLAQAPAQNEVEAEIKRIGEQTSAVLIAAHEQAQNTIREAQAEAERNLSEAKAQAAGIVCDANQRLHQLEREMNSVRGERERLLGDVRGAATALSELVDVSLKRFPSPSGLPELDTAGEPGAEPVAEENVEAEPALDYE